MTRIIIRVNKLCNISYWVDYLLHFSKCKCCFAIIISFEFYFKLGPDLEVGKTVRDQSAEAFEMLQLFTFGISSGGSSSNNKSTWTSKFN